jgi:hypothetical protein
MILISYTTSMLTARESHLVMQNDGVCMEVKCIYLHSHVKWAKVKLIAKLIT